MREKRFFVSSEDIKGNTAVLSSEESHHLKNVLRLKKGDSVIIFSGNGQEFEATVDQLSSRVSVAIQKQRRTRAADAVSICLAQSLPKKKKMDFIISKAAELGVSEVFPMDTERSILRLTGPESDKVVDRWQKIAVQTCKQSHLDWIPKIHKPLKFKEVLQKTTEFEAILVPHTDENLPKLSEVIAKIRQTLNVRPGEAPAGNKSKKILIVIGPEGGYSEKEIQLAVDKNKVHLVHLGDLVLKTETAAVVGVALLKYAFNL